METPSTTIQAIFFDFGWTLIYTKDPWPPIYRKAHQVLLAQLHQSGVPIDEATFTNGFDTFLDLYYADREESVIEKTTFSMLRDILTIKGFPHQPDPILRRALDALYSVTQQNWYLEEDAISTLKTLAERGFRLGMISNTSDDQNVYQLLDRYGLRAYFETVVTSAECGIRKPDERIFQEALDRLDLPASQTAMIGDSPEADILGANRMGMYSIWITRRAVRQDPTPAKPDKVVKTLAEIPALFRS